MHVELGTSHKKLMSESEIPLPFSDDVEPPVPTVDLDQPTTLTEFKRLAESNARIYVATNVGRGRHHGKVYYRLSIHRFETVKLGGRFYKGADVGPEEVAGDLSDVRVDEWSWGTGNLSYYNQVKALLEEHASTNPDLAQCADALYRHILRQYDLRQDYQQKGLIKFWFSCYNVVRHHRNDEPFRPRIIGRPASKALLTAFPDLERWTDIPLSVVAS